MSEELEQRGLLDGGLLKGCVFGEFEEFNIGSVSLNELVGHGLSVVLPREVVYPFKEYRPPKKLGAGKPDAVYARRVGAALLPVAVREHKSKKNRKAEKDILKAAEQALFYAKAINAKVAIIYRGDDALYVNVDASFRNGGIVYFDDSSAWTPSSLSHLLSGGQPETKDPKPLAEKVWQIIWHATKEEPKVCLLTFVEIFVLKFLSDNLSGMPQAYSFYELTGDPAKFESMHGTTPIEYFVNNIRPYIKGLFPDNVLADESGLAELFGLKTVVSKTSIINGFAFLKSSTDSLADFNRTFKEILDEFEAFGKLTNIDSEFKLRLYETFLKRSARQQKLGQFFTPRNVVRPMIQMARLSALKPNAVVLDPAAGVGGFILEPMLFEDALLGNLQFKDGLPERTIKTVGIDVDDDLHLLAKANMLLHLVEQVRSPNVSLDGLNKAMAKTFILMKENKTLGSLQYPPQGNIDVILTNPPYVTDGSAEYRKALLDVKDQRAKKGTKGLVDLTDFYDGCGLGVESLFMRYISKALKPGGRAFVVLPLGFLNRTEPGPKKELLKECNVIASIQLPRNTFFNTSQKTYILVLERRRTATASRPDVLCGLARTIGESLDWRRTPEPDKNDLARIAEQFVSWSEVKEEKDRATVSAIAKGTGLVKFASAEDFSEAKRWDVTRFWSDAELVALGERDETISREVFIDEATERLEYLLGELKSAKAGLAGLAATPTRQVSLSDTGVFSVCSGDRVTTAAVKENPGIIPVYSCFKDKDIVKGKISAKWLRNQGIPIQKKGFVTINANGASVGKVFVRDKRCMVTDDVIIVRPVPPPLGGTEKLDLRYLAFRIREVVAEGGFLYEAKLFQSRVKELSIEIPVDENGDFDLEAQTFKANAESRIEDIVRELADVGIWGANARLY